MKRDDLLRTARFLFPYAVIAAVVGVLAWRWTVAPMAVEAHEVKTGSVVAVTMGTGTLEARVKATIGPKIQGRLTELLVDQNDSVAAGQLLARLDDAELKQQVQVAQAALAAAQAGVERLRADEARGLAVEEQARLNHQRVSELLLTQVAARSDLDKAVEQLNIARADLQHSRAAIVEARRQVTTAEETLRHQQERLADTRIQSPFDGLVVRRDRDAGDVVVPGSSILQIISTNELWISAWVDETAMNGLAPGQPATIVFRSDPAKTYGGTVARLGRQTDPETREFLVDVRLQNLPLNWAVGQRAEVFIETGRASAALVLPERFLVWRRGEPGLYVEENRRARWRSVTLGLRGQENVEITRGLVAGERVLQPREPGPRALRDGQRISHP